MTNRLDQMKLEILNKKFNKRIHSGYDPDDVDNFFDGVIRYLTELNEQANKLMIQAEKNANENKKLNLTIAEKNKEIQMLQRTIDEYHREGYSNQRIQHNQSVLNNRLDEISKKIK